MRESIITSDAPIELGHWQGATDASQCQVVPVGTSHAPTTNPVPEDDSVVMRQLQPVDGGVAAWRLLVAAFVFEALLWGAASSKPSIALADHYRLSNIFRRFPRLLFLTPTVRW